MSETHDYLAIAVNTESTVVAEFTPDERRATAYQSEAELERELIRLLREQAYDYLPIKTEADLVANLRVQLEALNGITFSDDEWQRFFREVIASNNEGIVAKTAKIQEAPTQLLRRDDGTTKNVRLIDKVDIHNNRLQVINQYEITGTRSNRYDVTVLVNGLPLVHIELKRRGVALREAFNQIDRYQRDSFWAGSGLFEYVQIFVISNGTHTKYYSNTTREAHIEEFAGQGGRTKKKSDSFEFTSWWATSDNQPIEDLIDFTKTFFAKHTILNILTRYCVFTFDRQLMVMRPYQIVATERILNRIKVASNYRWQGTLKAGGYIWHTTGSGKTLTSFKTAQLATRLPGIEKVLFVVDRKDLDYQTMKEYDKFEKGAANSNTSTAKLKHQLEDPEARIIITTIQKLSLFIERNPEHAIYGGNLVIIFDECHRSQFGDMHKAIKKAFKRYFLFGFTGTPIFANNAASGGDVNLKTTEQAFGEKLHTYTIVDAIRDKNVLPFRVDYFDTVKMRDGVADEKVPAIDTEKALLAPQRIEGIVAYILGHFNQKTKRFAGRTFELSQMLNVAEVVSDRTGTVAEEKATQRVQGFNSLFATASIEAAKRYYAEFKRQQADAPSDRRLKVALIYSFAVNEDEPQGLLAEEEFEMAGLDQSSRDFLDGAIADYNELFSTSYDTSADKFQNYYKDLSLRLKNRQVDLCIVVNMFLTGFDATTLNTLWVDKNLRQHGLLQAFSRTNRILNSVKTFGNIVCFRPLEKVTNDAIALFGDKEASGIVLLKPFSHYAQTYDERVHDLLAAFPLGEPLVGEERQKEFIKLWGEILRLRNILSSFDGFEGNEILDEREFQDYQSLYVDLYDEFRRGKEAGKENINDDIVFEIELVKQVEINIDYILMLVAKYHESNCEDKEIAESITRAIDSSLELRNKKDLIEQFVHSMSASTDVFSDWRAFVEERKAEELDQIIADEHLKLEETHRFIDNAFRDGVIQESGVAITEIMPPMSKFTPDNQYAAKKQAVLEKLSAFFNRFFGIG